MIQRVQTVFLLFAFLLVGLLFFIPFVNLISNEVYSISLKGVSTLKSMEAIQQPYWLTALGSVTTIMILSVIFLYKNRKLQMNLTLLSIFLSLGLSASMYFVTEKYHSILTAEVKYSTVFVFPIISSILLFLAFRAIKKDEHLIKSLDRLR